MDLHQFSCRERPQPALKLLSIKAVLWWLGLAQWAHEPSPVCNHDVAVIATGM